ncbi:hypothetical protein COT75_00225 [Candidatus Beckwithbacteria bacterium CG10_big_fil_rev_8_21_14_0_10_34_10]|uniref:tRNA-guanine(15) transglycosylase-like domain-containing protein n=1 Tax=Candidatus Beckwithbacteria bacterium CG10_big_fil_rev_8_21_14_0_10_34_10 TaxID=1974495 RepID=A0A2H0WAN0_9BACT|nr:MAG: hypothetical protein COT75_00225 [Candidatus Beckwithbacteria bacterium CG10_big_fil_rev_8_21_14_0_10_34_10]
MRKKDFYFKAIKKFKKIRIGEIKTPHSIVFTPCFMPVGTQASVKSLTPDDLSGLGASLILGGNTYHMYFKPGMKVIKKAKGMHRFMGWNRPMLTDSGGFQVTSLGKDRTK